MCIGVYKHIYKIMEKNNRIAESSNRNDYINTYNYYPSKIFKAQNHLNTLKSRQNKLFIFILLKKLFIFIIKVRYW